MTSYWKVKFYADNSRLSRTRPPRVQTVVQQLTSKFLNLGKPLSSPVKLDKNNATLCSFFKDARTKYGVQWVSAVPGVHSMIRKQRLSQASLPTK